MGPYFRLNTILSPTKNKCKKLKEFKTVFNGDTAYVTQLKQ